MKQVIAVTGASGFVGTNLVRSLRVAGHVVIPVSRAKLQRHGAEVDYDGFTSDFIDSHDIGIVIHLAGKAHDLRNEAVAADYEKANTILTTRLFEAFVQSKAHTFFFMSSVKAAADFVDGQLAEDVVPSPVTPYGKSKLAAEQYIQGRQLPVDKRYYIFRPCMIHGPGNKGNLNLLYKFIKMKLPWPLAAFQNQRSFLGIENLCFCFDKFISNPEIPSGIYHLADSESLSTNEVVSIISAALNIRSRFIPIPRALINMLAAIGSACHLPLNRDVVKKLTENYMVSNSKLLAAIGAPLPVSARDGITATIQSFAECK